MLDEITLCSRGSVSVTKKTKKVLVVTYQWMDR